MKAAVYAGTRNLYSDMVNSAKSLAYNSSVDTIYFLIEDSSFPYKIPDYINIINVSNQKYFRKNGPNVYRLWTWMVLMRAALTKIFPDLDRILSLDVDTIVDRNIDELWDLPLDDYYLAGVPEPLKSEKGSPYVNMGVAMFNLNKLRENGLDDRIITILNQQSFDFAEQDCINIICRGSILPISTIYNSNKWTEERSDAKIFHYAAERTWNTYPLVQVYRNMKWDEVRRKI